MVMLSYLVAPLLVSVCAANDYLIIGDDFKNYLYSTSRFRVEHYNNVKHYGIPAPPGGGPETYALYLTNWSPYSNTPVIQIPLNNASKSMDLEFVFLCHDNHSELKIKIEYPSPIDIQLCGAGRIHRETGTWLTEKHTIKCLGGTGNCENLDFSIEGETNAYGQILGLYSLNVTMETSIKAAGGCSTDWKVPKKYSPLFLLSDSQIINSAIKSVTQNTIITVTCPLSQLNGLPENTIGVDATCNAQGRFTFKVQNQGQTYDYSINQFTCRNKVHSSIREITDNAGATVICGKETRYKKAEIGFYINDHPNNIPSFKTLIEVCFDEMELSTKWTKHILRGQFIKNKAANVKPVDFAPDGFKEIESNVNQIYSVENQYQVFLTELQKDSILCYQGNIQMYLARGHLAPKSDFVSKEEQEASYYFTNVHPQWQVVNNGNWQLIERQIQKYAESKTDLLIATGGIDTLIMKDSNNKGKEIELGTDFREDGEISVRVPAAFWKVLFLEDVVFVTENNPLDDPYNYMSKFEAECRTRACTTYSWLKPSTMTITQLAEALANRERGKTLCCTIAEFKKIYCPGQPGTSCEPFSV